MKKSFGVLWGIVFVFIVAGNAHAMPWERTDIYSPLTITFGDSGYSCLSYKHDIRNDDLSDSFGDCGWKRTERVFTNLPRFVSDQTGASDFSHGTFNFSGSSLNANGCEDDPSPVPEPATMLILGCGLVGAAIVGRKKIINHTYPKTGCAALTKMVTPPADSF